MIVVNVYRHRFVVICPTNAQAVLFELELRSRETVLVERIAGACGGQPKMFHEQMADDLFRLFGGFQIITAHHHGVDIETRRGEEIAL